MDASTPLLCAVITIFNPLKDHYLVSSPEKRIGVIGLGGLGHMVVKFCKAFGHHVIVISTSPFKDVEAKRLRTYLTLRGIKKTHEMLDVWGKHNIACNIKLIKAVIIDEVFERVAKNDVCCRFIIDIANVAPTQDI
ncbi:hypothetical protein TSUD_405610 [Trifolium subterraneum]|uniref:D-isomer specific 2-hydroxyacid dehydrogenase NAD-binding domain-containing protein n=1 Tax=Trifolium subterraneum TaxID=3900 RepID=A0A2Z6NW09_TRISU|nr:hypothetical protein TSUD_405610 [Trifolium subterraneum]